MKINDERNLGFCEFESLVWGACFIFDEELFMKVIPVTGEDTNAVLLETGELCCFDDKDDVILVEAEITIK